MKAAAERREPVFKLTEAMDLDFDAGTVHFDTVAMEVEAVNLDRVGMSPVKQLHRSANVAPNLRPPAHRRNKELDLLYRQISRVGFDCGLQQRHVSITRG